MAMLNNQRVYIYISVCMHTLPHLDLPYVTSRHMTWHDIHRYMEVNRVYKWFLQFWNIGIKGVVFHQEGQLGQLIDWGSWSETLTSKNWRAWHFRQGNWEVWKQDSPLISPEIDVETPSQNDSSGSSYGKASMCLEHLGSPGENGRPLGTSKGAHRAVQGLDFDHPNLSPFGIADSDGFPLNESAHFTPFLDQVLYFVLQPRLFNLNPSCPLFREESKFNLVKVRVNSDASTFCWWETYGKYEKAREVEGGDQIKTHGAEGEPQRGAAPT